MKELIYTGIFAALGILFIVLLVFMFKPDKDDSSNQPTDEGKTEESGEQATSDTNYQDTASEETPSVTNDNNRNVPSGTAYIPGIYTTELVLNDQVVDVEVIVDKDYISSIRLVNLNESVSTMYPLLQPTFDALSEQIYEKQSLQNITYDTDSKYTSLVLLQAIEHSLEKAGVSEE
jgi:uncharacterized protein with FMN-binding domain